MIRMSRAVGVVLAAALALAGSGVAPAQPKTTRPKLVVVLVIDQFRADYLERFLPKFGPQGFRRLMREGAWFRSAYYPSAALETAPGHSTLATGTTADRHGIAGNRWYVPGKGIQEAIQDEDSPIVGGAPALVPASPKNLVGDTLSDELRLATLGRSRVFGVSLKDRASILSTGHGGTAAYWFDSVQGGFVTSKYYRDALPGWVVDFNARFHKEHPAGQPLDAFIRTAEANRLVAEFARELIERENIGKGGATDFLFVGFSSNDYAGHRFGPYSTAVEEITVETDSILARFMAALDTRIGRDNYWLALSGDHGVAPTLVQARDPQMARLAGKNIDSKALLGAIETALAARWGDGPWLVPGAGLVLDREKLRQRKVSVEDACAVAGAAAMSVDGIVGYVSWTSAVGSERSVKAYRLSRFPGRSADVDIIPEPFALVDGERGGTTHGLPYTYDTHVPLILRGSAFRPGRYDANIWTTDFAPTLAAALGISPPALATGRVLVEALRQTRPATAVPSKQPTKAPRP